MREYEGPPALVREAVRRDMADDLIALADALRSAQRAYLADRGNNVLGKAVGDAAAAYDKLRAKYQETSRG